MKKLPVGIQTIQDIIEDGYVYVDKTALILRLINEGKYYFLSRPRRFGKSLLLSTLKAIFQGEKKLFKGYKIHTSKYSWNISPVVHLDFTQVSTKNPKEFEESLKKTIIKIARSHNKSIEPLSLQESFKTLIEKLSSDGKVVVLVDEYDKPIIDHIHHPDIMTAHRSILKDLFGTLKGLDHYLRFVCVTGVSKFSQASLFSGFNNLEDITIAPDYATLLGYTEEEIKLYFQDHLKKISQERAVSKKKVLEEMKEWYNGYQFSWGKQAVYNPHSTLNFLKTGRTQGFWFRTGTPTLLIELIKKNPSYLKSLSGAKAKETELLDIHNLEEINLIALMWQTGYLTFINYDPPTRLYELDFPNEEVRLAFFESLIQSFTYISSSDVGKQSLQCWEELCNENLDSFFERIRSLFAKIPYKLYTKAKEDFYHANLIILLESMGIKVRPLEMTNTGEIDLVIETPHKIYIFELKFNKTPKRALKQIREKHYPEKYFKEKKKVIAVGVNFSFKIRNVISWKSTPIKTKSKKSILNLLNSPYAYRKLYGLFQSVEN